MGEGARYKSRWFTTTATTTLPPPLSTHANLLTSLCLCDVTLNNTIISSSTFPPPTRTPIKPYQASSSLSVGPSITYHPHHNPTLTTGNPDLPNSHLSSFKAHHPHYLESCHVTRRSREHILSLPCSVQFSPSTMPSRCAALVAAWS